MNSYEIVFVIQADRKIEDMRGPYSGAVSEYEYGF
jgi:hypothetical protein